MLQTFLSNLWTTTLIVGCLCIILFFLSLMFAIINSIVQSSKKKIIENELLNQLKQHNKNIIDNFEKENKKE